nr:vegetative cell wall protein gp1-like [Aegilops tauschii subsp. strangulata]
MLTADSPPARPSPVPGTISTTSPCRQGGVPSPEEAAAPAPAPPRHLPRQPPATAGEVARGPGRPQPPPPAGPPAPDLAGSDGCDTTRDRGRRAARGGPARDAANHARRRSEPPPPHRCTSRQCSASTRPGHPMPAGGGEGRGNKAPPPPKPAGLCPLALAGGGEGRRREGGRGEPAARVSPASLAGAAGGRVGVPQMAPFLL